MNRLIIPLVLTALVCPGLGHVWLGRKRLGWGIAAAVVGMLAFWLAAVYRRAWMDLSDSPIFWDGTAIDMVRDRIWPIFRRSMGRTLPWMKPLIALGWVAALVDTARRARAPHQPPGARSA